MTELGLADTNGILRQPWVRPGRTSAGPGWDGLYVSSQPELPYRASFDAARTHLVILHLDGPVTVRRGHGRLSRSRQVPTGGLFLHPAGRDLTVELGGNLRTVHAYLDDGALRDARGEQGPPGGDTRAGGTSPYSLSEYAAASPCGMIDLPQTYLEPILVTNAAARGAKVRFDTEFLALDQDEDGVTARHEWLLTWGYDIDQAPPEVDGLSMCWGARVRARRSRSPRRPPGQGPPRG
jgi:hypothetical protein